MMIFFLTNLSIFFFQKARMDLWDGNNEPFISQNETARKNKHQKRTFYQRVYCPRLTGYKVLSVQWPGPRATVSHTFPSCQPNQTALTTW